MICYVTGGNVLPRSGLLEPINSENAVYRDSDLLGVMHEERTMSMEDMVRKRHELEDRVSHFLSQIDKFVLLVKTMETRDIEICIAKLYDLMTQANDEVTRLDRLFKGLLVKSVYDKRQLGEKKRGSFLSGSAWTGAITKYKFVYPVPLTETLANEWGRDNPQSVRKLLPM